MVNARTIALGGVDYEVRPMAGILEGYEVWRGPVELGFFTVSEGGAIEASSMTHYQMDGS